MPRILQDPLFFVRRMILLTDGLMWEQWRSENENTGQACSKCAGTAQIVRTSAVPRPGLREGGRFVVSSGALSLGGDAFSTWLLMSRRAVRTSETRRGAGMAVMRLVGCTT